MKGVIIRDPYSRDFVEGMIMRSSLNGDVCDYFGGLEM